LIQIVIRWGINAVSLWLIAYLSPRLGILPAFRVDGFETAVVAAGILALVNALVRPVLLLLTLPVTMLTFGLFTFVINALMLMLTAYLVRGFETGGFVNALLGSVILSILSVILNSILNRKD
jgi:putative membrane protein